MARHFPDLPLVGKKNCFRKERGIFYTCHWLAEQNRRLVSGKSESKARNNTGLHQIKQWTDFK